MARRNKSLPFNGNIISPRLTPEQDAKYLQLFRDDPKLFMERYLKIRDKASDRLVPFKLNPSQKIVYDTIQEIRKEGRPVRLVIPKCRQKGVSTLAEGLLFCKARLWPNTNSLIVADRTDSAQAIFSMTNLFYDELPSDLKPLKRFRTKSMLRFENEDETQRLKNPGLRSEIRIATAKNPNLGRGFTIQAVHASEVAFWTDAETTMNSIMQAVPDQPETFVLVESTANGLGGYFYRLVRQAMKRKSDWRFAFLPFWIDDEYMLDDDATEKMLRERPLDEYEMDLIQRFCPDTAPAPVRKRWRNKMAWRRWAIPNKCGGSVQRFSTEYAPSLEEMFVATGETVFSWQAINFYFNEVKKKEGTRGTLRMAKNRRVYFDEDPNGKLIVWRHPQRGVLYSVGADGALGQRVLNAEDDDDENDRDYSTAIVLSWEMEQVASFACKDIQPWTFAEFLAMLGMYYGNAIVMPEVGNQGAGYGIISRLKEIYPHIARWEIIDHAQRYKKSNAVGWEPTSKSLPKLISKLEYQLRKGAGLTDGDGNFDPDPRRLKLWSKELVSQFTTYAILKSGRIGAQPGAHDDLVRACGLALLALEQIPSPHELRKSFDSKGDVWDDTWRDRPLPDSGGYGWLAV